MVMALLSASVSSLAAFFCCTCGGGISDTRPWLSFLKNWNHCVDEAAAASPAAADAVAAADAADAVADHYTDPK